ncbi:hypothetical protein DFH27DRAFT_296101 [Peziza echinospora]|nr:hypothetical protein DFH27DRAFT_296101 [Peziza echinospora]
MAPPHSNSNSTTTTRRRNLSDTQPQPQPSTALTTTTANTTSSLLSPTKPKPTTTTKMATPRPHRPHHHQTPRSTTKTNARTPIRRVRGNGTLTSAQKRIIVDNIGLEMNDRIRRLRAQYDVTAQALKHRIEMRINRVPKKLWSAKMGELLFQHVGQQSSKALLIARNAAQSKKMGKGFVEEVREVKRFRYVCMCILYMCILSFFLSFLYSQFFILFYFFFLHTRP